MFSYAYEKNEKPEKAGGAHPPAGEGSGVWGWPALCLLFLFFFLLVLLKDEGDGQLLNAINTVGILHQVFTE